VNRSSYIRIPFITLFSVTLWIYSKFTNQSLSGSVARIIIISYIHQWGSSTCFRQSPSSSACCCWRNSRPAAPRDGGCSLVPDRPTSRCADPRPILDRYGRLMGSQADPKTLRSGMSMQELYTWQFLICGKLIPFMNSTGALTMQRQQMYGWRARTLQKHQILHRPALWYAPGTGPSKIFTVEPQGSSNFLRRQLLADFPFQSAVTSTSKFDFPAFSKVVHSQSCPAMRGWYADGLETHVVLPSTTLIINHSTHAHSILTWPVTAIACFFSTNYGTTDRDMRYVWQHALVCSRHCEDRLYILWISSRKSTPGSTKNYS